MDGCCRTMEKPRRRRASRRPDQGGDLVRRVGADRSEPPGRLVYSGQDLGEEDWRTTQHRPQLHSSAGVQDSLAQSCDGEQNTASVILLPPSELYLACQCPIGSNTSECP
jgi:hypothetical protein